MKKLNVILYYIRPCGFINERIFFIVFRNFELRHFQVFIKEFYINSVLKDFAPFWIDQDGDLENDPYTTDCSAETNMTHPHAYSDITIQNGQVQSKTCIEKQPGFYFKVF